MASTGPRTPVERKFISAQEVALLLGLSRSAVLRRVKLGILAGYPDPDINEFWVARDTVEEALRRRKEIAELAEARFLVNDDV